MGKQIMSIIRLHAVLIDILVQFQDQQLSILVTATDSFQQSEMRHSICVHDDGHEFPLKKQIKRPTTRLLSAMQILVIPV